MEDKSTSNNSFYQFPSSNNCKLFWFSILSIDANPHNQSWNKVKITWQHTLSH